MSSLTTPYLDHPSSAPGFGEGFYPTSPVRDGRVAEWVPIALATGLLIAFIDEVVRKALPGQPVQVTAVKEPLFFLVGLFASKVDVKPPWLPMLLPWAAIVLLTTALTLSTGGNLVHSVACLKTYLGFILLFGAGVCVSQSSRLIGFLGKIFLAGMTLAAVIGVLQQIAPGSLPQFLLVRSYIEKHSLAGAGYSESLFSSPSIFAQALLLASLFAFDLWCRKGKLVSLLLLPVFLAGLWASHIRVALVFLLLGLLLLYALSVYREGNLWNTHSRGTILALMLAGVGTTFALAMGMHRASAVVDQETATRDLSFYERILNREEILQRLTVPIMAVQRTPPEKLILGYGAGTGGALRRFLPPETVAGVPRVTDDGVSLLVRETGILGAVLFFVPVLGILLVCSRRIAYHGDPVGIPIVVGAWVFTVWFTVKSHAVMSNSFSQIMWFGCMGIAYGMAMRYREQGYRTWS